MDIPPSLLPPVRENFPKGGTKKYLSKNNGYKPISKKDTNLMDNYPKSNDLVAKVTNDHDETPLSGRSIFQMDTVEPTENHSNNYRPVHGLKYVQNYKSMLKQRGVRYQEIFGHSPRKPEERSGINKELIEWSNVNSKLSQNKNNDVSTPRALSKLDLSITNSGVKFPKITVNDSKECSFIDPPTVTKENSIPPPPLALTDPVANRKSSNPEQTIMLYDDFEARHLGRMLNSNLDDVLWRDSVQNTPMFSRRTPVSSRKGGKLGDLITPKHMDELLEDTSGILKFENGLEFPSRK